VDVIVVVEVDRDGDGDVADDVRFLCCASGDMGNDLDRRLV
jgi:hypothetical protein